MIIKSLSLENFRNYDSLDISFCDGINLFYGFNGQGKTNLLESIFICSVGKSFRTVKDIEMIKHEKDNFSVKVNIDKDITDSVLIKYDKKKQKAIAVNGMYLRKTGQLMGGLLTVLFCPEDMLLLSEGPSLRRRFLDIAISQLNPLYYYDLQQYSKLLIQKNIQLKNVKVNPKCKDLLFVWNEQIADYGSRIIHERVKFINSLKVLAVDFHSHISDDKETLFIKYEDTINTCSNDVSEIKCCYLKMLEKVMAREIERESSIIGPHRDDILFKLNDLEIKKYGSQGQKRTAVLALKMAEIEIMKNNTGRTPVLLLDDVMSELDKKRQIALLSSVKDIQTFITCVDKDSFASTNTKINAFNITDGRIR